MRLPCQTKPIPESWLAGPQGRLCETKPISLRVESELSYCQEKSYVAYTRLIGCAKQSQFAESGSGRRAKCTKQTQFGRAARPDAPPFHYCIIPVFQSVPIVRNKPNCHPRRGIGGASPTLQAGAIAPNKPNSARPGGRPAFREGKCAKQSQKAVVGSQWSVASWRADHAKQSQFRPTGPRDSRSIEGSRARTPNLRRVGRAKQSQSRQGSGLRDQGSATRHQMPGPCPPGLSCETKPIRGVRPPQWLAYPPPYAGHTPCGTGR